MKIDKERATEIVRLASIAETPSPIAVAWTSKIKHLSELCEQGVSKTHIAFLGTTILAKALNSNVDLYAVKPSHAQGNENAYSARSLCHHVLVPLAAELAFSLGVTGREPLNNQPYFRMTRLGDSTPVHGGGRAAFDYMLELVSELYESKTEKTAIEALKAFIAVRKTYQRRYELDDGIVRVSPDALAKAIAYFVGLDSEGGRRAQAAVAGLLDVFAGIENVESGRINDPSRHYPGDVCVRSIYNANVTFKAFEVRDKPVSSTDVKIFGKKCVDGRIREAAVVMTSIRQQVLDSRDLLTWARELGLGLTLFYGWESLVEQALFWSSLTKSEGAARAVAMIAKRLVALEVRPASIALWHETVKRTV